MDFQNWQSNVKDSFVQRLELSLFLSLEDFAIYIVVFILWLDVVSPFSDQFLVFPDNRNTDRKIVQKKLSRGMIFKILPTSSIKHIPRPEVGMCIGIRS